jgi:phosphatidylinositol alpha-1,6-mannosyltransferase
MRILMLDNEFPPLGGGMGTVNEALLKCYAKLPDLEIDLITSALGGHRELEKFSDNIRVVKLPVWNQNIHHSTARELMLYAIQSLPQSLQSHHACAYDYCLAWSTVPAGAVALALNRLVSLPYIVWVSGPDIPGFEQRYRYIYRLLSPVIRHIWRNAAHVIAKCAGEIEMIRSVDKEVEASLIPNGVDLQVFQPDSEIPDKGPLHIICVARLIERKGQHHLIEAVKQLNDSDVDVVLSLVGTGDSQADYEKQVRDFGIQTHVRFVGYVPREEIASYYKVGHVFALPSYNEGMSLAVLEAMAAGLPVVVTRTGGTAELVENGLNGFTFDWADVKMLVNHLHTLANDRALARRMGAASRARAMKYSWEIIAAHFLNLFHNNKVDSTVAAQKIYGQ